MLYYLNNKYDYICENIEAKHMAYSIYILKLSFKMRVQQYFFKISLFVRIDIYDMHVFINYTLSVPILLPLFFLHVD